MQSTRAFDPALRRQGAASVEAVIALPVLALLMFGIVFAERASSARHRAMIAARRCGYQYAVAGCVELPEACGETPTEEQSLQGKADSQRIVDHARSTAPVGFDVFDDVPLIGEAISGLFGSTIRVSQPFATRAVVGERMLHGRAELTLACNERPRSVGTEVERVFCKYLTLDACGGGSR